MLIIGLDYHPSVQQIAFVDLETGETGERQLNHNEGEVEEFYRELKQRGINVRVGMEATGSTCWFERLMTDLGFELWIGGTQSKFEDNGYGSRRRIVEMRTCCSSCWWKIAFPECGYPARRTVMFDNCFGIVTGWCRCGPAS